MQQIELSSIKTDAGTQSRAALNEDVIAEYAEAIRAGANMPPVTLYHDGKHHFLADGFHRYFAHQKSGAIEIDAEVFTGTNRDAILYSASANSAHGLRRTNEDKRCAVHTLLSDKEWSAWSDRQIARRCSVSPSFVGSLRPAVTVHVDSEKTAERKFTTRHGTEATMKTAPIAAASKARTETADFEPPKAIAASAKQAAVPSGRITELESALALMTDERDEAMDTCRALAVELEAYEKASEGVEAAAKEIKLLNEKLRVAHSRCDQMMVTDSELKKQIESQSRQIKALNKKLGASK